MLLVGCIVQKWGELKLMYFLHEMQYITLSLQIFFCFVCYLLTKLGPCAIDLVKMAMMVN